MLKETIGEESAGYAGTKGATSGNIPLKQSRQLPLAFILCTLAFVACFLLMVTPLIRVPDSVITIHLAPGTLLSSLSSWWPHNVGGLNAATSAYAEVFALLGLAFFCYALAALLVRRSSGAASQRGFRGMIWSGAFLAGIIFVVTPGMLSHDIFVYASYSRLLAAYHANPYFVPIAVFPQDPFMTLNYWSPVISAYGPIWMLVCGLFGWFLQPDPAMYTIAFRLFALCFDLLNLWLVGRILQGMGRSARTVTLGMLLYAWNPLLLLESGLGGHNDGFMMTFVLVGILLAVRAEKGGQTLHARGYLPTIIALTLAALVKFTALPILAAYLLYLICKALRPTAESPQALRLALRHARTALLILVYSVLSAALVALAFYGPFWLGHSPQAIMDSLKNPPSSLYSENSFLRSILEWGLSHPTIHNGFLNFLGNRSLWDILTSVGLALCLLVGATRLWQKPTTRTFVVTALGTMSLVLILTPWFFSWYITWLLALGIVCLPVYLHRLEAALLALALTFSFSALLTYLFNGNLFGTQYYLVSLFTTIPPTCAFLCVLILWKTTRHSKSGAEKR